MIDYLLFVGMYLYLFSTAIFLYMFVRTCRAKDGIGLVFLKIMTGGLTIGSLALFTIRFMIDYGGLEGETGRALAIINPIILLSVGLYLNYLFINSKHTITKTDAQNIKEIKSDVKDNKDSLTKIKHDMVKRPGVK